MKNKINIIIIFLMLVSSSFFIMLEPNIRSIALHEPNDGITTGTIENATNKFYTSYSFYSCDDVTLVCANPNTNYNSDNLLRVHNNSYTQNQRLRFLLKFNLSSIPDNVTITNAVIMLYSYSATFGYNIYAYKMEGDWDEHTATWNNQPSWNSTYTDVTYVIGTGWRSWNVKDDIQSFLDGNHSNYGWGFKRYMSSVIPDHSTKFYGKPTSGTTYDPYLLFSYTLGSFDVNRTVYTNVETNNLSFIADNNYSEDVTLRVPVSNDTRGITAVYNYTDNVNATQVNDSSELINNTFWYDSTNQFVYIRTVNLTIGSVVNWSVNCSYGATFNIVYPSYLDVGDYFMASGLILNSSGDPIDGFIAKTRILFQNGSDTGIGIHKWNCVDGNYLCIIATNGLIPGVYLISMEFTDTETGTVFKKGGTLYISYDTPTGVYSDAILHVRWYNTNLGLGLPVETLQLFINNHIEYNLDYYTYLGATINVTVKDYYNFTLYSDTITINRSNYPLNLGLTFHEYDFTNSNDEYYVASFLKEGATRWFEKIVPAYGHEEFLLPTGNYTIRVYNNDNSSYVSWTTTINNSRGYLINGNNITMVIEGLSRVEGQILEFQDTLDYALTPDIEIIWCNPPLLFITMDKEGMAIGETVIKICPSLIVQATTRVETSGNWINSTPMIPGNGSIQNGTIILLDDVLYIDGPWNTSWVNITYSGNGTLMQNTSYIPGMINLEGQNITINASHNIHITRICKYYQQKKFYWSYTGSTGYHEAGINITNNLNVPIFDVYFFIEFSNRSNPDGKTVVIRDHGNNGEVMKPGVNYQVSLSGINSYVSSINASSSRSFTISYYKEFSDNYYYGEEQINAGNIEKGKVLNGEYYRYVSFIWINDNDRIFRGGLLVKIDENAITEINKETVKVYDKDNNFLVDDEKYIIGDTFIRISMDALGDVPAGGGRNFEIYFQEAEYPGADPQEIHLSTPLTTFLGIPWTPFLIIFLFCCIPISAGITVLYKKKKFTKASSALLSLGFVIIFITALLQNMGL